MNKKSKRITLGLVSALCLLLVVALGFGVTGAWYRARRTASGTIKLDKGIILTVTDLDTGTTGESSPLDSTNVNGQLWVLNAAKNGILPLTGAQTSVSTQPGETATKNVVIPTIAAAAGSTSFYAKAKIVYTFKAFGEDNEHNRIVVNDVVYNAEDLFMTAASTTNVLDGSNGIFSNLIQFNGDWSASGMGNGYYLYIGTSGTAGTPKALGHGTDEVSTAVSLFTNDSVTNTASKTIDALTIREWTGGDSLDPYAAEHENDPDYYQYVEFGGPKVYVRVNTTPEAAEPTYTYTPIEIAQINLALTIDVIQSENLTTPALNAWKAAA